jgi:hypothetical protein
MVELQDSRNPNREPTKDDLRSLLVRYGFVQLGRARQKLSSDRRQAYPEHRVGIRMVGPVHEAKLAWVVSCIALVRPSAVNVGIVTRMTSGRVKTSPTFTALWRGSRLMRLVEMLDWTTGNERFDKKLQALRRYKAAVVKDKWGTEWGFKYGWDM